MLSALSRQHKSFRWISAGACVLAFGALACDRPEEGTLSDRSPTPQGVGDVVVDARDLPQAPPRAGDVLTIEEIEQLLGFEVLAADRSRFRAQTFHREVVTGEEARYYELYAPFKGGGEGVISLTQKPVIGSELGGPLVDFEGWQAQVKSTSRNVRVRFFTGAFDAEGHAVRAEVRGRSQESVREFVAALTFEHEFQLR